MCLECLHAFVYGSHSDVAEAWRKYTWCSLDGTETKLLTSGSKPIHEGFPWIHKEENWNPLEKEFWQNSVFIVNSLKIELSLEVTMYLNSKNKS